MTGAQKKVTQEGEEEREREREREREALN